MLQDHDIQTKFKKENKREICGNINDYTIFGGSHVRKLILYSKMVTTYSVLSTKSIYLSLFELLGLKSTKFHNVWSK